MEFALDSTPLLSDLGFCVLRNHTDYPFVFSDSPVVFYNMLMRNVTSRGVLGFQSPGLQMFFPLEAKITLMFYDKKAYELSHNGYIDITERSDVSQLNALQLKHSLNTVYFGDWQAQEYVANLWAAHGRNHHSPLDKTRELHGALVNGIPQENSGWLTFEPHLDHRLSLSFLKCHPLSDSGKFPGYRTPALLEEHKKRKLKVRPDEGATTGTDATTGT